jgi:rhodanese-related sulfurtransferase
MNNLQLLTIMIMLLNWTGCGGTNIQQDAPKVISPVEANKILGNDTNYVFIDVRTEAEYKSETGHLKGAIFIPIQQLESRLQELEPYRAKTIILYCRSGNRSGRAEKLLTEHGFRALNLTGGMIQWNKENLPVVKESQ